VNGQAVVATELAKVYRRFLHQNQFRTLKSALLTGSLLSDLTSDQIFTALDGVSFEVPKGSTFGVIGENGSGKSTLLKLLAGITKPTRGRLNVDGRVSALIELGAGFHPEISGRENVAINGIMLGLTRKQVEERFDAIVAFAELERFIEAPVKTYSSGMYMRLGFAVAIHVDPDVLLIDEVLAVGDEAFSRKCLDKIGEFRRRGKTILIVSHSLGLVEKMCDDVLWLRRGKVEGRGDPAAGPGRLQHHVGARGEGRDALDSDCVLDGRRSRGDTRRRPPGRRRGSRAPASRRARPGARGPPLPRRPSPHAGRGRDGPGRQGGVLADARRAGRRHGERACPRLGPADRDPRAHRPGRRRRRRRHLSRRGDHRAERCLLLHRHVRRGRGARSGVRAPSDLRMARAGLAAGQRPGDCDSLLLTTGDFTNPVSHPRTQTHTF